MARSIVVGVVGDSGAGKTTVTRGLARVLSDAHVRRISADDYHRYERRRRAELGVTRSTRTPTTWTSSPST